MTVLVTAVQEGRVHIHSGHLVSTAALRGAEGLCCHRRLKRDWQEDLVSICKQNMSIKIGRGRKKQKPLLMQRNITDKGTYGIKWPWINVDWKLKEFYSTKLSLWKASQQESGENKNWNQFSYGCGWLMKRILRCSYLQLQGTGSCSPALIFHCGGFSLSPSGMWN